MLDMTISFNPTTTQCIRCYYFPYFPLSEDWSHLPRVNNIREPGIKDGTISKK